MNKRDDAAVTAVLAAGSRTSLWRMTASVAAGAMILVVLAGSTWTGSLALAPTAAAPSVTAAGYTPHPARGGVRRPAAARARNGRPRRNGRAARVGRAAVPASDKRHPPGPGAVRQIVPPARGPSPGRQHACALGISLAGQRRRGAGYRDGARDRPRCRHRRTASERHVAQQHPECGSSLRVCAAARDIARGCHLDKRRRPDRGRAPARPGASTATAAPR
jgi:hypothetical protein